MLQSSHLLGTLIKDVAKGYAMMSPSRPSRDAGGCAQRRESFLCEDEGWETKREKIKQGSKKMKKEMKQKAQKRERREKVNID